MNDVLVEAAPSQFHKLMSSAEEEQGNIVGSLLVTPYHGDFKEAATLPPRVAMVRNRVRASDRRVQVPVPEFQLPRNQQVYVCSPTFLNDLDQYGLAFNHIILGEFPTPTEKFDLLFGRYLPPGTTIEPAPTTSLYFTAPPSYSLKTREAIRNFMVSYLNEGFSLSAEEGNKRRDELESTSLSALGLQQIENDPMQVDYLKLLE